MKSMLVACLIMIALLTSCSKDNPVNPSKNKEIYPMKLGNKWTYNTFWYLSSKPDSTFNHDTLFVSIDSSRIIKDEIWFISTSRYKGHPNQWGMAIGTNRKDGFWYLWEYYSLQAFSLYFQYPTIINHANSINNSEDTMFTKSINYDVIVPAGKFQCIDYKYISQTFTNQDYYFYPGVGLIKNIRLLEIKIQDKVPDTLWAVDELISYEIK